MFKSILEPSPSEVVSDRASRAGNGSLLSRQPIPQEARFPKRGSPYAAQNSKRMYYDGSDVSRMDVEAAVDSTDPVSAASSAGFYPSMTVFNLRIGLNSKNTFNNPNSLNSLNISNTLNTLNAMNPPPAPSAPSAPSIDASFPAEPDAAPPSSGGFISARSQYILDQQRKYGKTAVPDKSVSPFPSPPESPAANPSAGSAVSPRPPRFPAVLRTIR